MLQDFILYLTEVNTIIKHLGILLIGAVPFLEAFVGAALGAFLGIPLITAAISSMIGNWISIMLIILPFDAILSKVRERKANKEGGFIQNRANKAKEMYNKYGVPGLAILTPLVASGHIAAFTSIAAGANKKKVIFWHTVSIIIWGVLGAAFGHYIGLDYTIG
ncbi:small multi-drug export protein [Sutcliffiella rhizosphaerae]|uniref:Small multi-drug export protein n=1 Tax=Sutcliffiella rhizosphaerae TaxID=2880967 RepID=A0ABM8YRR4_9BACI|nr:small multi-drug export protein [Sutcliffiella rhizosphaerae]CAG9622685.1 hypothetical protein BACCIP111883_03476 [Sutcliffiella rhizosphaerae]